METWKDIKGYEGLYQVSDKGRVRSLDRKDGINRNIKGRVLAIKYCTGNYQFVCLSKNGIHSYPKIHRLVAETFIPNPENKPTVNHIDENNQNNNVENLEWATYMENAHHGTRIERCYANRDYSEITKKATATRIAKGMFRHVKQYDTDMKLVAEYDSVAEASRCIGTAPSNIHHAIKTYKGKKPYLGYIWV